MTWEGKSTDFVDGFGLCSPTRWRPSDRGGRLSAPAKNLARQLHHLARDFVCVGMCKIHRRFAVIWRKGSSWNHPSQGTHCMGYDNNGAAWWEVQIGGTC